MLLTEKELLDIVDTLIRDRAYNRPAAVAIAMAVGAAVEAEISRRWRENSNLKTWFPLTAERLEKLEAENAALKRDLQYARDGLTKGRSRLREDNERLREVAARMVAGIDHLDKLTRDWEPDHSSGADRRGWLLAKDARDEAVRVLGPNVRGNLDPTAKEET